MDLPKIKNYGKYSSDNYGSHSLMVTVGNATVFFSYQTPVAFQIGGNPMVVSENCWGPTTGKHLNWIDGGRKNERKKREEFERLYREQIHSK